MELKIFFIQAFKFFCVYFNLDVLSYSNIHFVLDLLIFPVASQDSRRIDSFLLYLEENRTTRYV